MTKTERPAPTTGPGAGLGLEVVVNWAADGVISTGSVITPSSEARKAADKQFLIAFIFIVVLSFNEIKPARCQQ